MKSIKKLIAAVMAMCIVLSLAGCHKKNEIAVTVGDVEFTSAYYMCALVMADSQARTKVQENLSDDEKNEDIDYYSQKIDDKKYVDWVKETALDSLKMIAAYKIKCNEAKIDLEDSTKTTSETYADYYWSSYGYQSVLEPNGVAKSTYTAYMTDSYYSSRYFEYLYGKDGEKEISDSDVKKTLTDNFEIADILEGSYTNLEDKEKTELKSKFESYLKDLKDGKKTFEEVYKDYNKTEESEDKDTDTDNDADKEESKPLDSYATLLGSEDTDYSSDHYETVKKMKKNEMKLVTLDDDAGIAIIIKKDISADPYYLENLDLSLRYIVKNDEFTEDMEKYADTLKVKENSYAIGQFKVKKIVYPEATA